ncbi:hypothetical protein [Tenacibaculum jejuense]|uniref:Uncharacterized protein n=1 Tax=Tenacibaculum jejuense TaxID=584609 RepID=A0A238UFQ7_9FLAO|nr:hypothetical protein [Tenacibaculum jejuense]SNR17210.1 conserved membrane protein of unknown function [Tenacibaculum jejuense]
MIQKLLIFLYLIISFVFGIGILLSFYDYSYSGYYSEKFINWTWLSMTFLIVFRFWKKRFIKIFSIVLISIILLSILPMAIPFLGILNYFSTYGDYQQIQLNSKYRLERTKHHPLSPQRIFIYEKKGILEKNICRSNYDEIIANVLSLEHNEYKLLPLQYCKLIEANETEVKIEYQILNKKKIVHHKLNNNDGY